MIRTVLIPDSQSLSIQVPKDFVGKHVQVIAFTLDHPEKPITHRASAEILGKDWLESVEDEAWQDL